MCTLLYLQRCCRIQFLRNCTSVVSIKSFHSIPNDTQLLKSFFPVSTQVRTFWESFPYVRPLFYEKDGLSRSKYELIYHFKIFNYVFYGQLITSTVLAIQLFGSSYYAYKSYIAQEVVHAVTQIGNYPVNYDLPTLIVFTLLTIQNCLIIVAAQNSVLRVYHCEDTNKFVFVKLALNPFKSKLHYCNPGELIPQKDKLLNIIFGTHELHGKNMYLRYDNFKSMHYYNELVGDNYKEIF